MNTCEVMLHEIAHGRAGDKGNRLNISVIAYVPEAWPVLVEQVTAQRVHDLFRHRGATRVVRHLLPNLGALNFVIDEVLEGGVNSSLNVDVHGKSHSFRVLSLTVTVPTDLLEASRAARASDGQAAPVA